MHQQYDVAIFGGGLCGVVSALTLADTKKKVLLVERRPQPGWEVTSAFHCELHPTESPFMGVLCNKLHSLGGIHGSRVDPPILELLLDHLMAEKKIEVLYYSCPLGLITEEHLVRGVVIGNKNGKNIVQASVFVDATEEISLWQQTSITFARNSDVPARQMLFFNGLAGKIRLPFFIGDAAGVKNITIQPSVWDKEVCIEFDVEKYSMSISRLVLPKVISFIRENFQELTKAIITHIGFEPFPLDVHAYLKKKTLRHPYFRNLFAAGLWTIPEKKERQQSNTPAGRIELGEKMGIFLKSTPIDHMERQKRNITFKNSNCSLLSSRHQKADVIVVGGGTAGVIAAIAAARQGVKTILLETGTLLGGTGTGGGIHEYYCGIPGGLQDEVDARVKKLSSLFMGKYKIKGFVSQEFHPWAKEYVLEQMCQEASVEVVYNSTMIDVEVCGAKKRKIKENSLNIESRTSEKPDFSQYPLLKGVVAVSPSEIITYCGKVVIDSTGDGDVAAMAGVRFIIGRESDGLTHAFGQNVGYLNSTGDMAIINRDTGYVDPIDVRDLTRARRLGLQQCWQERFTPETRFLYIAPILGIRQSRQIVGDYQLTFADEILGREFTDCIGYLESNYDNHANDYENESDEAVLWVWLLGNWKKKIGCEIPYRCLLPRNIEGLLVACRALSVTIDAQYACRMQRDMQEVGEAAGIAAALSIKLNVTPRALDVKLIQDELRKRGVINERRRPKPLLTQCSLSNLKEMLLSDKPQDAVWLLTQYSGKEVLLLLKDVLHSGPSQSRFWAAVALAMHKDNEAVPELLNCVRERRNEIPEGLKTVPLWWSAIVMLGRIGDSRAIPVLLEVLFDEQINLDVSIAVVRALGRIQDKSAISGLRRFLKRLQSKDFSKIERLRRPVQEDVRWQIELAVAETLAKLGEPESSITDRYLDDPRTYVRRYATKIAKLIEVDNNSTSE